MPKVNGSSIAVPVKPADARNDAQHQAHDAAERQEHQAVRLHQCQEGLARRRGHEAQLAGEILHLSPSRDVSRCPACFAR